VALVNETLARRLFGNGSPLGRRFSFGKEAGAGDAVTIVGLLRDAKFDDVRSAAPPTAFVPYTQMVAPLSKMNFAVRTVGDPLALSGRIREIAGRLVPGVPIGGVKTQAAQIDESLAQERMFARLFTFFGFTALALACLGLQGTMAYTLRRRTREIGIRMALGAARGSVLRMAVAETLVIAVAGILVGVGLAAGGARFVTSLVFGITPLDTTTLALGAGVMLAVAVLAGYGPARRAARIDPMRALRDE